MKRLLIGTFLLLYTTFTVVTVAERTFSWAGITADSIKSGPSAKPTPSHSSQTRFLEQPFVVPRLLSESRLIPIAMAAHTPAAEQLAEKIDSTIPSRAPPAL
jgi:hypothetical protein